MEVPRNWFLLPHLCGVIDLSRKHIKSHWSKWESGWNIQGNSMVFEFCRWNTHQINSFTFTFLSESQTVLVYSENWDLSISTTGEQRQESLVFAAVVSIKLARANIILTSFNCSLLVCLLCCIYLVAQSLGAVVFPVWSQLNDCAFHFQASVMNFHQL